MGEYLPYSGNHSIQEAQIGVQFHHEFGQHEIERARSAAEADLKDVLPRSAEIRGGSVTVDLSNPGVPAQMGPISSVIAGFQFSKVMGDGRPARALQLSGNLVSANIVDYDGWEKIRTDSIYYITTVLAPLPLAGNPVMAFMLRYIDRFTFNGGSNEAKAGSLFMNGNDYIATHCFAAGSSWHCHTGWFDSLDSGRVLNNLNVSSAVIDLSPTVIIDHQATLHLNTPRQSLDAVLAHQDNIRGLSSVLEVLHDSNKGILRAMLLPEMLAKIGISI